MNDDEPMAAGEAAECACCVLSVREGLRAMRRSESADVERIFSVVLSAASEDFSIVATAVDPQTHVAIPAAGSVHPDYGNLIARPPFVMAQGIQRAGGGMTHRVSRFFNVRVRYMTGPGPLCFALRSGLRRAGRASDSGNDPASPAATPRQANQPTNQSTR